MCFLYQPAVDGVGESSISGVDNIAPDNNTDAIANAPDTEMQSAEPEIRDAGIPAVKIEEDASGRFKIAPESIPPIQGTVHATPKSTAPVASLPKTRLPHDTTGILEDRIKDDPRGDMEGWLALIAEHRQRNKLEDARAVYERFFKVFPQAVSYSDCAC